MTWLDSAFPIQTTPANLRAWIEIHFSRATRLRIGHRRLNKSSRVGIEANTGNLRYKAKVNLGDRDASHAGKIAYDVFFVTKMKMTISVGSPTGNG